MKNIDPSFYGISTYNGDKTDKYSWSQGIKDVTMQIPLPEGTKPAQLKVVIQTKHLFVAFKGKESEPLINGVLGEKVKVDDSFWSVEDNRNLNINFEKAYEVIWKCMVQGDKEIDTEKVDNSKRVEDFDLETQGHLKKVLWEQERKRNGFLTEEEQKQKDMMDKVINMPNSPFAGMTYDPNRYGKIAGQNTPSVPFR